MMRKGIALIFTIVLFAACDKNKSVVPVQKVENKSEVPAEKKRRLFVENDGEKVMLKIFPGDKEVHRFGAMERGMLRWHTRIFENGNMLGLLPDSDSDDWILFFADLDGNYTFLEKGTMINYHLYGAQRDAREAYVLYVSKDSNWLEHIDKNGNVGDKIFFDKPFIHETMKMGYDSLGNPVSLVFVTIDGRSEYRIDLENKKIFLQNYEKYEYNGYKP